MSHMQSVPGGVEQEALAEEKELAEDFRPEKGRKKIATGEGRLAFFLVTPTVLLLALIGQWVVLTPSGSGTVLPIMRTAIGSTPGPLGSTVATND